MLFDPKDIELILADATLKAAYLEYLGKCLESETLRLQFNLVQARKDIVGETEKSSSISSEPF